MVFVIAELGTNHLGDIDVVKKMIDVAVSVGCDAVKLQKKNVEKIYTKEFLDSPLESPWGTTQREMRLHREFSMKDLNIINKYCIRKKIPLFFSCWDIDSQIEIRKLNTKFNKVASAMLPHKKLLEVIAEEKKYTFISTAMSTMKDIETAIQIFKKSNCKFELMHCHGSYPMNPEEANLNMIKTLQKKFKCSVGYSGHEISATDISIPAVIMGATSIERHITLNRTFYGHDQAASLEPDGIRRLVRNIRIIDKIMGDGKKRVWETELEAKKKLRQKFV
jgi:N-acetylneuraminate synthase